MFKQLGPPQLFLTFSCDDFDTEYEMLLDGGRPWSDPVLFAQHYKRSFQRLLNYYILRNGCSFSRMVGGITNWSYTVELQDRGSPHVHLVLWTGDTADELLASNRVVCAQIPNRRTNPELHDIVLNRQIHACGNYCVSPDGNHCRFGYPKAASAVQEYDPLTERVVYRRAEIDSNVNPYNAYLLCMLGTSMDIQVNFGTNVAIYLSKYLSKTDSSVNLEWGMENIQDHFRARVVGAVDAAYFLSGWSKHRSSRGTIFISIVFPGYDERRQLRRDLDDLPEDDTDIFYPTHLEKYLERHQQTHHLTMVEYFTVYRITKEEDVDDVFDRQDRFGFVDRDTINNDEETILDTRIGKTIPIACTDNYGRRYVRRLRNRLPFWRSHFYDQASGEPFFYQLVCLYCPFNDVNALRDGFETWRELYFHVCNRDDFGQPDQEIEQVRQFDESMQNAGTYQGEDPNDIADLIEKATIELPEMLNTASYDQNVVFNFIADQSTSVGPMVVYGAAGCGKSFLLNMLAHMFILNDVYPVVLSPTGVAAYTVGGKTIHSFFGIDFNAGTANMIRVQDFLILHPRIVFLIDECSMISSQLVDLMDEVLRRICQTDEVFGGATVIFFGDIGQLPPVDLQGGLFFTNDIIQESIMFKLQESMRQSVTEEQEFLRFLNSIRRYEFDDFVLEFIRNHIADNNVINNEVLRLYAQNNAVDDYNNRRINEYPGEEFQFIAEDIGNERALNNETELLQVLRLKIGVKVMLLSNLDVSSGWVNGCTCEVIGIDNEQGVVHVRNNSGETKMIQKITRSIYRTENTRTQYPLRLAFASTIHRVQSLTLTHGVAISLALPFDSFGQFYVACSRATSGANIYFFQSALNRIMVTENQEILEFLNNLD